MAKNARGQKHPFSAEFYKVHTKKKGYHIFQQKPRSYNCILKKARRLLKISKLDKKHIREFLHTRCFTIEHQIIELRNRTVLTYQGLDQRLIFTQRLLDCLYDHHKINYEGLLFGSTINGLAFHDSDVDLRLRPLKQVGKDVYEPQIYDSSLIEKILSDIARQTTRCSPALGTFVPSMRCPIAKLTFLAPKSPQGLELVPSFFDEGINFDISISTGTSLGTFNSIFIRFLNNFQPKFHLLAMVIRYWSNVHGLIVPGYLSSYALINMLIYFCQKTEPPLLPTVDYMREIYLNSAEGETKQNFRGITQMEWNCLLSYDRNHYFESWNRDPLSILLLKFFEFYLKFPYSTQIITIRPGKTLSHQEFQDSALFHPRFPIKPFINIQDPFDLTHNLTSGMQGAHFRLLMVTIRYSYERLFKELLNQFSRPSKLMPLGPIEAEESKGAKKTGEWGLNVIFIKLTKREVDEA